MRLCKHCGCNKPYNPDPFQYGRKASGFKGNRCWPCAQMLALVQREPLKEARSISRKNWEDANPGKVLSYRARRRTGKLQRTPLWADHAKIEAIYAEAASKGLHVDHIIPLQNPLVSGLHVHNNLQLLTKAENSSKSNKFEVI